MAVSLARLVAPLMLAVCLAGSSLPAEARDGLAPRQHRQFRAHGPRLVLRHRDRRILHVRRQAPDFLIQAYLPRTTDRPIYNEPPSRFPGY